MSFKTFRVFKSTGKLNRVAEVGWLKSAPVSFFSYFLARGLQSGRAGDGNLLGNEYCELFNARCRGHGNREAVEDAGDSFVSGEEESQGLPDLCLRRGSPPRTPHPQADGRG